jgi:monothiol bacilliredoxin
MMKRRGARFMENKFININNVESLNDFLASLNDSSGVLFKHSNSCGISSRAYAEMAKLGQPVGLIVVQNARAVSDEIERRWSVSHETPQVLIVHDGKVVWSASHFQIKAANVEAAMNGDR